MATVFGSISAPPAPWATRAASSTSKSGARPPTTEAMTKVSAPAMNTRRRPTRSTRRPPNTSSPASGRRLPLSTHCTSCEPTPNVFMMSGSASGTAV